MGKTMLAAAGDTIMIGAATYPESLNINANLRLPARARRTPSLMAKRSPA